MDFATWYTLQHGYMPGVIAATTYTGNLANGTLYLGEFGRVLLNAPVLLLTGRTELTGSLEFYSTVPWPGLVFLPAMLILGVHALLEWKNTEIERGDRVKLYTLTYALAVLGFPSLIYFTASSAITDYFGWIFLGLFFYAILKRARAGRSQTKFTVLAIVALADVLVYHHTTALFMMLLLGGVIIVQLRRGGSERPLGSNMVVSYCVLLIAYVAYLTVSFNGYVLSLQTSLGNLTDGLLGISHPSELSGISTTNQLTLDRILFRVADVSMIFAVFAMFGLTLLRRKRLGQPEAVLSGFMIGTVLAAAFVIGWGGFGAFFIRISALSAVVTILGAGQLLLGHNKKTRRTVVALGIVVLLVSPLAYISSQPAQSGALRFSEASGLAWANRYVDKQGTILSDSRLASPLIYFGFRNPLGLEDEGLSAGRQEMFIDVYRGLYEPKSPDQVARAVCKAGALAGVEVGDAIYSSSFAHGAGVIGYLNSYYPAYRDASEIWGNVTSFERVYDSGTTAVFHVTRLGTSCSSD